MRKLHSSPHIGLSIGIGGVMGQVLLALLPAIVTMIWFFGWGLLYHLVLASLTALVCEALVMLARRRPCYPVLCDGSALVSAFLFALCLPPWAPWWMDVLGMAFAILVAKQLFGGLGFNPFNPAMLAYVLLLIAFPLDLLQWLPPFPGAPLQWGFVDTGRWIFGLLPTGLDIDALTAATPLDRMRSGLRQELPLSQLQQGISEGGRMAIAGAFLLGGLWMLYRRLIQWHIPLSMLASLLLLAAFYHWLDSTRYPSALFHLLNGAAIVGAFFIATDPVSAPGSYTAKLIFGAGAGILTYVIRQWGGYPDGVAFAVLMMNMLTPTLDYFLRPRALGEGVKKA